MVLVLLVITVKQFVFLGKIRGTFYGVMHRAVSSVISLTLLLFIAVYISIIVEPVVKYFATSVHQRRQLYQSLALRKKCVCATLAMRSSTSVYCTRTVVGHCH